ncbi:MAG: YihY/virulence factor BrkB family protein [Candidatus Binatia bacterium]
MRKLKEVKSFFDEDLWRLELEGLSRIHRYLYRHLRILYLVIKGFIDNRCLLLASALTYTTLLSLVPLLALMFSILKGLGVQNRLEPILLEKLSGGSEEVVIQIIGYIEKTNVRTLGGLGLVGLIATAISVIGNIELSLNRIWGVQKARSLGRKFSDYLSVLLTCPILLVAAMGLTSSIQSATVVRGILQLPGASHLVLFLAILSPYFLIWIALTFVYSYLPNTTVPLRSAIFGGVIAGTLWQLAQWGYVHFQIGVAKYNAIYGVFAQFPIFLVWLYLGWTIVLLGAVISFAHQNIRTYEKDVGGAAFHYSFREELGLKLLLLIARNFYSETEPWTAERLSSKLDVPIRLVNEILYQHCHAGILMPASKDGEEVYLLAKAPESLRMDYLIETIRNYGGNEMKMNKIDGEETLRKTLDQVRESRRTTLAPLTLRDMLAEDRH